jgi:hypothetical protein
MRSRLLISAIVACVALAGAARAQDGSDRFAGGLVAGDYLRLGGGISRPINAQGSLSEWSQGPTFSAGWENWQAGGTGVGRIGFGLNAGLSLLPLNEKQFVADFTPTTGGNTNGATAGHARIIEITSNLRIRIPAPLVMPAVNIAFGFINWAPGDITYTSTNGVGGKVKQGHRSGAELALGGSLDRQIYDRFAAYVEAMYVYGYTSYGQGFETPGGTCARSGCDALKNTTFGTLRGGLRVNMGR